MDKHELNFYRTLLMVVMLQAAALALIVAKIANVF